jgi:hypothetical protein
MSEVYLAFAFPFSKTSVQEPGRVNKEGFLAESSSVKICGWAYSVVRIGLESHHRSEKRRVDIGCCVGFPEQHVVRKSK